MLLLHPRCLETLRVEIDAVADDDEAIIPFDKIKDLPYLRACLDESMRIYPPTTFGLPRKTPSEGCNILGDFIAGNTSVSMSAYVVHRDEKVFPEAETFRPERWLDDGKKLQPYFITFSAGARGCIGRNISYLEQIMLIAAVVHRYEMELPSLNWRQSRYEHFNLVPGPLPLKLRRRSFETQKSF
jgi:cytochrome P450